MALVMVFCRCTLNGKLLAAENWKLVWARAPLLAGSGGACADVSRQCSRIRLQIAALIIAKGGFGQGAAAAVLDHRRGGQINQMRSQIAAVHLPLIGCVSLAQQRSRRSRSPVIFLLHRDVAEARS